MFSKLHVAFFSAPEDPAGGTSEAENPEQRKGPKGKATFRGLRPVDPNAPWTIHMRPKPGAAESD
jgi:hypothetical protein